ncbi:hypothetical protein [Adhaeribacter soli]|uniref:Uncharacterized protein n=1 Tax=Adhaeribacter soli TaxID=2607655 RepID=A0A5N1J126_9BACT|nr:hypothetical protein [Adhaeribacter soli]KAA9338789.1 hypothetical protein F0P94_08305 [Adhaeribacter soli]
MHQLCHPRLASQLQAVLTDPEAPRSSLRFAIDMVLACEVRELTPILVNQALDVRLPFATRSIALDTLVHLIDNDSRVALRPLRLQIPLEDTRDEFRGDLLRILWPSHLSPEELLPLLTPEKDEQLFGSYRAFLLQIEKEDIAFSLSSVLASLQWLSQNVPALAHQYSREDFWIRINKLVWRSSWQFINEAGVLKAMTKLFIVMDEHHQPFSLEEANDETRFKLFESLLHHKNRPHPQSLVFNFHNQPTLLSQEDWDNVYALVMTPLTSKTREWLTKVLILLLDLTPTDSPGSIYSKRYDQLHEAKRRFASSRRVLYPRFKAEDLTSEDNLQSRKYFQDIRNRKRKDVLKKKRRRKLKLRQIVKGQKHIQLILVQGITASFREWNFLLHYLSSKKTNAGFLADTDISQSNRWAKLSSTQKNKVVDLAYDIILRHPIPPQEWFTLGGGINYFAISLYRAILLCQKQRPAYLQSFPANFWENWSGFLVQLESTLDNDHQYELVKLAAISAPTAVDVAVFQQADAYDDRKEFSSFYQLKFLYQALPKAKFSNLMLLAIKFNAWRDDYSASVLVDMLNLSYKPAMDYAMQLINEPNDRLPLTIAVYKWLLFKPRTARTDSWEHWEQLSTHPNLAATVIRQSVNHPRAGELQHLAILEEQQLHTLILWLTYAFKLIPEDIDDWDNSNPLGSFGALRTAAASELASRGTISAWELLKELSIHFGAPYWVQVHLDQVRENLRRNSWEPITPDALIALSQDSNRRWIKSATDLQELVLESLNRFQIDLHNELIAAEVLWIPVKATDRRKKSGYEVRDENFLSNVIRRHLVQDLQRTDILVKREVEIRSSLGRETGQRTDIFVDAFSREVNGNKADIVSVVIEVKLSKNKEVETALNNQLIPYLIDQKYKHGIYLIGWHYGNHDNKPSDKKSLPNLYRLLEKQTQDVDKDYFIRTKLLDIRLPADKARSEADKPFFEVI